MMKGRDSSSVTLSHLVATEQMMFNLFPHTVIVSMTIILRHDPAAKPLMEIPISNRFHP